MMNYRQLGAVLAIGAALSACAAPSERFYTLTGAEPVAQVSAAPFYIEVQAVSVPPQVQREQLLITGHDGGITVLEQERWAGPLAAEIGQALSLGVSAELGAIDVYRTPHPAQVPLYRISTRVQRFESAPGRYALVDAVWSVRRDESAAMLTCHSVARVAVADDYRALVAGHRRALGQIAAQMSGAIRRLASGGSASCGA